MSSEAEYFDLDREIFGLFRDDASRREHVRISLPEADSAADPVVEVAPDADDERRISRIVEKARFELLVRDSVEFLFKTMGAGTSELTGAMFAAASGGSRGITDDADRADESAAATDPEHVAEEPSSEDLAGPDNEEL